MQSDAVSALGLQAFKELSAVDPEAPKLLEAAMESDESDKWSVRPVRRSAVLLLRTFFLCAPTPPPPAFFVARLQIPL